MDSIQQQINALSSQVEALYGIIERLSSQTAEILARLNNTPTLDVNPSYLSFNRRTQVRTMTTELEAEMLHKDVLSDSNLESSKSEQSLTPEIQIQRLTAQLTAAYNRIAALEEQLLAQRVIH
jgi:hypothetical protein